MRIWRFCLPVLLLAACAAPEPRVVEVRVPVPVRVAPPAELVAPIPGPEVEAFVPAGDPRAVLGVTADGWDALTNMVGALERRIEALRAWAAEDDVSAEAAP